MNNTFTMIDELNHKIFKTVKSESTSNSVIVMLEGGILPKKTNIKCFWDRNSFKTVPVSCPIKKDKNGVFLSDGVFCSFNCCMAYLHANSMDVRYRDSKSLLNLMYYEMFGKYLDDVIEAPSWRLLEDYGGNMTIQQFRDSYNNSVIRDMEMFKKDNNIGVFVMGTIFKKNDIFS